MVRLSSEPSTVREAREFVDAAVGYLMPPDQRDGLKIAVTEMVSITLNRGRPPFDILADIVNDVVRVEVHDRSMAIPHLDRSPDSVYGLMLLDALAKRWGVTPSADGKIIWAELPLR